MSTTEAPPPALLPVRRRKIRTNSVQRHPANARRHDLDRIRESLRTNGWWGEVAVQASTGLIVAGNGRHEAAELEGMPWIHGAFYDVDDGLARRMVIADNRTSDLAGYDQERLADLLRQARLEPEGLTGTGYTEADYSELLDGIDRDHGAPALTDVDDVPEPPAKPRTKPGDLWRLGPHRLLCGDATKAESYDEITGIGHDQPHAIITDPPYGVEYVGKTKRALTIVNDDMLDLELLAFITDALTAAAAPLRAGGAVYVFHAEGDGRGSTFRLAFTEAGLELKQCLVWVKNTMVLGRQDYHWQHEPILYGWKPGAAHRWFGGRNKVTLVDAELDLEAMTKPELVELLAGMRATSSVIREAKPHRNEYHPTMKPVRLITRLISNSTRAGDTVLDPFAGSGSTLIAAHTTGRTAQLLELDPVYCDVICRRYQEHTGSRPTLARTNRAVDFGGTR